MKNIVLTRIDDRIMHGQVVVSWIPYLRADEVIIIDDDYANDEFMSLLIKNAAPDSVRANVFTVKDGAGYLKGNDEGSRIFLISKNVGCIKKLLDLNVKLDKVNIGNLGSSPVRKKYYNTVYLSDGERSLLKEIAKQTEIEIRMLPHDKAVKFE